MKLIEIRRSGMDALDEAVILLGLDDCLTELRRRQKAWKEKTEGLDQRGLAEIDPTLLRNPVNRR